MHVFLLTFDLLHVFPLSHHTWFIAWVTPSLLHALFLTLGLLHVFLMSHDTWFIALVTLGFLHVFLLTHGLLHVFLMGHDYTCFIVWVTPNLLHASFLTLGMHFRPPNGTNDGVFLLTDKVENDCHFKKFVSWPRVLLL